MLRLEIANPDKYVTRNQESYVPVDLTWVYLIVCRNSKPTLDSLKTADTAIVESCLKLHEQVVADGIKHVRVKVGDVAEGLAEEVLEEEFDRVIGFCAVIIRTIKGYHLPDILPMYGLTRERVIHALPELYTFNKEPRLRVMKFTPVRELVKGLAYGQWK